MVDPPGPWVFLYLMQLLLLSLALGTMTLHQPKLLAVARLPRFLIGFCVTPYVLGVWMLFVAGIFPGAPRWLFLIPPSSMATVLMVLYGPRTLRRLGRECRRTHRLVKGSWAAYFIYAGATLVMALVISKLVMNSRSPIGAHDALVNLDAALPFVQERSISAVTGIQGRPDGSHRGSFHSFVFPAFLSHALMVTGDNPLGYPYDHAVRAAFQITVIYMLLSVVALAGTAKHLGVGALAIILLLQVPGLEYVSRHSSRDAFRIIPLMLLATTLAGLSPQRLRERLPLVSLIPAALLAWLSVAGHTLGGFVVATVVLAWLIWCLLQRARWFNLALVLAAIGLGLLLGGVRYISLYVETGKFIGEESAEDAIAGTVLEGNEPRDEIERVADKATMVQRLDMLLERDRYHLSVPGLVGAILAIAEWVTFQREERAMSAALVGLMVLAVLLPFVGVFDVRYYRLSLAAIQNSRYALHWYPFAAVAVAILITHWYDMLILRHNTAAMALLILVVAAGTFSAYRTIRSEWPARDLQYTRRWFSETVEPLQTAMKHLPVGKRMLLDDSRYNYYLGSRGVIMYSRPTWEVIRAKSYDEARSALETLNIGAVALSESDVSGWWDQLPLFGFLDDPENTVVVRSEILRVYIVVQNSLHRNHLMEAYLESASDGVPAGDLCQTLTRLRPGDASPGYAYLIEEEWDQAIETYEAAVKQYPDDLSYHACLAKAYRAQGRTEDMLSSYRQVAALLTNAEVGVPYLAAETDVAPSYVLGYLAQGETYQSPVGAEVAYSFLDHLEQASKVSGGSVKLIRRSAFVIDRLPKGVIYQHPSSNISYSLKIPANAELEFSLGIAPEVWQLGRGDGAGFQITLQDEAGMVYQLFSEYIDPKNIPAHRRWHDRTVSLSLWSGQTVTVTLTTDPGPNGDDRYDWAGWGEPRLGQPVVYNFLDSMHEAAITAPELGQIRTVTQTIAYEARPVLFQHPPSRVVYSLTLPIHSTLRFGLGMDPAVWSPDKGDGVEYNLYLRIPDDPHVLHRVFHRYLDPKDNADDRRWFDEQVDLSQFGGQETEIIFEALPGPVEDANYDWGGWSTPVLVDETLPEVMGGIR